MSREYTPKQIEKYKRQKYISALNKCTNNLYKIFKKESSNYLEYRDKFIKLKSGLSKLDSVRLDTEHFKKVQEYIDKLYNSTIALELDEESFKELKNKELSELNRLQKMKNRVKYSKHKHKHKFI